MTIPLAARLSHRTSKRHAYRVSLVGAILLLPLLALAGFLPAVSVEAQLVAAMVLAGLPIALAALLVLVAFVSFRRYDLPDDVLHDPEPSARS